MPMLVHAHPSFSQWNTRYPKTCVLTSLRQKNRRWFVLCEYIEHMVSSDVKILYEFVWFNR